MITSKQRAYLRKLAMEITPIIQIGKGGINDNLITTVDDALEARELIKLSVLDNCDSTPGDVCNELAELTGAEAVAAVGRRVVLYRESSDEKKRRIILPVK